MAAASMTKTKKKRARVTYLVRETPPVTSARRVVRVASAMLDTYVLAHHAALHAPGARERYETTDALRNNLMEGVRVGQAGSSCFARFAASYEAWKRGAKWATEERLTADAEAFAAFVNRECRPLATVIPMRARAPEVSA